MATVALKSLIDKMNLINLTPGIEVTGRKITQPEINRPALQLTGFFEHYDTARLEIVGFVEYTYMQQMPDDRKQEIYGKLLDSAVPGVIFCRDLDPDEIFIKIAEQNGVPVLKTSMSTSGFMAEVIRWLNVKLAPCISIHGVLVDVNGEGVLITGESGIGKSEAALELVKRGHRLISDDVVEIRKVSDDTLIGSAPDITKHFIELRGIGIIDVKALFGTMSVKDTQSIDLVIRLEDWDKDKDYDRLGLEEEYTDAEAIDGEVDTVDIYGTVSGNDVKDFYDKDESKKEASKSAEEEKKNTDGTGKTEEKTTDEKKNEDKIDNGDAPLSSRNDAFLEEEVEYAAPTLKEVYEKKFKGNDLPQNTSGDLTKNDLYTFFVTGKEEEVEGVKILTAPFRFCLYGYSGFNEETGEFLINDEALDNPAVAIDSMYVDYNSLDRDDDTSGAFLNHLFRVFKGGE